LDTQATPTPPLIPPIRWAIRFPGNWLAPSFCPVKSLAFRRLSLGQGLEKFSESVSIFSPQPPTSRYAISYSLFYLDGLVRQSFSVLFRVTTYFAPSFARFQKAVLTAHDSRAPFFSAHPSFLPQSLMALVPSDRAPALPYCKQPERLFKGDFRFFYPPPFFCGRLHPPQVMILTTFPNVLQSTQTPPPFLLWPLFSPPEKHTLCAKKNNLVSSNSDTRILISLVLSGWRSVCVTELPTSRSVPITLLVLSPPHHFFPPRRAGVLKRNLLTH